MRKVLVIGSSGQLAAALVEVAAAQGVALRAIGRPELDLLDTASVRSAIAAEKPTGVINAAAYVAVDRAESEVEAAFALNRDATGELAHACADAGVPLVHVSTDYVFDGSKNGVYVETDERNPLGVYGRSKSEGEDAVFAAGGAAGVIRTAWVYSAGGANFVKTMLRLAAEGREEVGVVADQLGRPTYAPDLAEACLALLGALERGEAAARGVFHYAGANDATWADFAEAVFAGAARRGLASAKVKRITTAEFPTPAQRPANSRLDSSLIAEVTGVEARDWRGSLEACLDRIAAGSSSTAQ